jgi:hypothetical protein
MHGSRRHPIPDGTNGLESRTHLLLEKNSPETRPVQPPEVGRVVAFPRVGGLHHRYEFRARLKFTGKYRFPWAKAVYLTLSPPRKSTTHAPRSAAPDRRSQSPRSALLSRVQNHGLTFTQRPTDSCVSCCRWDFRERQSSANPAIPAEHRLQGFTSLLHGNPNTNSVESAAIATCCLPSTSYEIGELRISPPVW